MSEFRVDLTLLDDVATHPNADRLELANVKGWQVIVGKGRYKIGDAVIYTPIDSILPEKLADYLFPEGSKISRPKKNRIRAIKIRGQVSQGMIIDPMDEGLHELYPNLTKDMLDTVLGKKKDIDVAELLGITKYEPPTPRYQRVPRQKKSWKNHPMFAKYVDINNFKFYPNRFKDDDKVNITEKIHGTSARYGLYERATEHKFGWLSKMLMKLGVIDRYQFVYGSRNIQLQSGGKQFYDRNVYGIIAKKYDIKNKLKPGESLYGEIVGPDIQKGYDYGYKSDGHYGFYAYDVKNGDEYVDVPVFQKWCQDNDIPTVPVLYEGLRGQADLDDLRSGKSTLAPKDQPVTEGIVIKSYNEDNDPRGRKILKHINDDYYLLDQTDFH